MSTRCDSSRGLTAYTSNEVYIEVDVVETDTGAGVVMGFELCVADVGESAGC
jgi:hypothetical protein